MAPSSSSQPCGIHPHDPFCAAAGVGVVPTSTANAATIVMALDFRIMMLPSFAESGSDRELGSTALHTIVCVPSGADQNCIMSDLPYAAGSSESKRRRVVHFHELAIYANIGLLTDTIYWWAVV